MNIWFRIEYLDELFIVFDKFKDYFDGSFEGVVYSLLFFVFVVINKMIMIFYNYFIKRFY